jgi:formamidopyrimidine-DNA glycosylase
VSEVPELPEVETIRRIVSAKARGRRVISVTVHDPKFIQDLSAADFSARLTGKTLTDVARRGKYLVLTFAADAAAGPDAERCRLVAHLMMAGRLIVCPPGEPIVKHTHVVFGLDNGLELRYIDLRHFGRLALMDGGEAGTGRADATGAARAGRAGAGAAPRPAEPTLIRGLRALGVEPLSDDFTVVALSSLLARRKGRIKAVLLDQRLVAGIGNIYADEVLFMAGIHPRRTGDSLAPAEVKRLHGAIRAVLAQAIEHRGTTILTYVDGEGRRGEFAGLLQVYQKHGAACPRCGTAIVRAEVAGRGTHFCPRCQR